VTTLGTPPRVRLDNRLISGLIIVACILGPVMYVLVAQIGFRSTGFPLDDAWIYQVYARNLAQSGQWAFVQGQPSTGSTSVLWTLLVTPAYLIGIDGRAWTLGLGVLSLIGAALAGAYFFPEDKPLLRLAAGLAVALEWHMVWAAVSGMETALFAAMLMGFWVWLQRRSLSPGAHPVRQALVLGLWGGGLVLARPEGIVAFGVGAVYVAVALKGWPDRMGWAIAAGLGLCVVIAPLLAFNLATGGTLWPNTFAAKQAEYAPLLGTPYLVRLVSQVAAVWVGPQLVLVPGLLIVLRKASLRRPSGWFSLLPLVWVGLHLGLYAARLPVTYQHARYAIPTIPPLIVVGLQGLHTFIGSKPSQRIVRALALAWPATAGILFPTFLVVLGAPAYGRDVLFIQDEMVATARWVEQHTSPQSVIALHDIGALGYFSPHRIVDLAGLVSPQAITFINDDQRLADFIRAEHADYLIVFPHWNDAYARLVSRQEFCKVWSADQNEGYVPASNLGAMSVYRVGPTGGCPAPP
jgi:hypothetical protein